MPRAQTIRKPVLTPAGQRPAAARHALPDRVRGVAVVLMVGYHLSFDLTLFGYWHQAFNVDWRWLALRALILCLFMGSLGVSVVLAHGPGMASGSSAVDRIHWPALLRRQARLAGACVLVSLGSALVFPQTWIWFGVLHFAWVATWLALALRGAGRWLPGLALAAAIAGNGPGFALFDTPALGWIGLMTAKPYTEDYVPLLPWLAPVLIGVWLAPRLLRSGPGSSPGDGPAPGGLGALDRGLRRLGRHTLLIYLLHQPVLLGVLQGIALLRSGAA